jgi:hypothetical protein
MAQPSSTVQSVDGPLGPPPGLSAATMRAAAARANRVTTATAATEPTGQSSRPSLAGSAPLGSLGPGGLGALHDPLEDWHVRLAYGAMAHSGGGGSMALSGAEDDPLTAALEAAAAKTRAAFGALEGERVVRQALETKLREARATADRKAALVRWVVGGGSTRLLYATLYAIPASRVRVYPMAYGTACRCL